jgi:hypothetical protein
MRMSAQRKKTLVVAMSLAVFLFASMVSVQRVSAVSSKPSWTFMVYLDADNSLNQYGAINLQAMSAGLAGASVSVIVLADWLNRTAALYLVTSAGITILQKLPDQDMGNSTTLEWFVTFAMKNYSAAHYFLDLWDHGGGFFGVCWDQSSGHHLSPHDVETAVATAELKTKQRVDIIGFDACLMGMVEVCYELKDVTNYVVASELLIPGLGWPYTNLMTYVSNNNPGPEQLCSELVKEYVASYPKTTVQMSAVNENRIPELATSLNNFAGALILNISTYQEVIAGARGASQQQVMGTVANYYFIDLYKFAKLFGSSGSQDLMDKLKAAVFAEAHSTKVGNLDSKEFGLTIYFPPNIQKYSQSYADNVPNFVTDTTWVHFLMTYYSSM